VTINAEYGYQTVLRPLVGGFSAVASIILTLIFAAKPFERDFNENSAYLMHTIPVKVSDLIISKAILYYVWYVSATIAAILAVGFGLMDFSFVGDLYEGISESIDPITLLRTLISPISLFGFIISVMATGHLAGTRRRLGEGLFVVCFLIACFGYTGILVTVTAAINIGSSYNISSSLNAAYLIDFFINIVLTAGFYIYTHWVYTKRLNVL
jgi:hypothetical protein